MKSALNVLLFFMALIELVVAGEGPVSDGMIYGHAYDAETKKPISNAWVYCLDIKCSKPLTDNDGHFAFERCFSRSTYYKIQCSKNGYQTSSQNALTDTAGKADIDFYLDPERNQDNIAAIMYAFDSRTQLRIGKAKFEFLPVDGGLGSAKYADEEGYLYIYNNDFSRSAKFKIVTSAENYKTRTGDIFGFGNEENLKQGLPAILGYGLESDDTINPNKRLELPCIGIISGRIINAANELPVPFGYVSIKDSDSNEYLYTGIADVNGHFSSSPIFCRDKAYELISDTFGYTPALQKVITDSNGNATASMSISQEFEVNQESCSKYGGMWQNGYCNFGR